MVMAAGCVLTHAVQPANASQQGRQDVLYECRASGTMAMVSTSTCSIVCVCSAAGPEADDSMPTSAGVGFIDVGSGIPGTDR